MHNNIGGSNFLSSDVHDLQRMNSKEHGHQRYSQESNISSRSVVEGGVSFYSAKAEFYTASVSEDGGYKILAQALSAEYSATTEEGRDSFALNSASTFETPSPLDVANKVLGFVESRLNSELESGADSERITSLISQAREGVQKGFAQAREDIESLGLMTEKLNQEIDAGFDRINGGLNGMQGRYVDLKEGGGVKGDLSTDQVVLPAASRGGVDVSSEQFYSEVLSGSSGAGQGQSFSRSTYLNSSDFFLKTQDGDTISIRYDVAGVDVFKSAGNNLFAGQSQFQGYQLEVSGELDEDEMAAISNLFSQLGEVSALFFEGDFQDAFASALDLGFDSSEIASFSLDLSKIETQEVRTYSNAGEVYDAGQVSIKQNQPLVDMVSLFDRSLELLKAFDVQQFNFRALIMESIAAEVSAKDIESKVALNDFSDFSERLIDQLKNDA